MDGGTHDGNKKKPSDSYSVRGVAFLSILTSIATVLSEAPKGNNKRNSYICMNSFMARKEGFEPSHRLPQSTPLAGEPLEPLGYFRMVDRYKIVAEREGFEPPVPFGITGFQDQRHKPLGHLSSSVNQRCLLYALLKMLSIFIFGSFSIKKSINI